MPGVNYVGGRAYLIVAEHIEELLGQYPAPTHLRMDNGPEFIAHALQEWCTGNGSGTEYIPPRFSMGESICGVIQRQAER